MYCPHVCGGSFFAILAENGAIVLSTRVWGKPVGAVREKGIYSTVHTCVGEAITYAILSRSHWYCPHVCGGSDRLLLLPSPGKVLSTRVWGKHEMEDRIAALEGTVHTCVGEAKAQRAREEVMAYCPHVCGGSFYNPGSWISLSVLVSELAESKE